jgi:nucleoid DNA-binding protein
MEKYLLKLLNNNLRIIIPDFGAFIIRQKEPLIIVFNELLRYNDGLLIDYIARQENIEKEMARHQVSEYSETLIKTLEAGTEIKLEGIGTLHKTSEGKIEFIQAGKDTVKKSIKKPAQKKPVEEKEEHTVEFEILPDDTNVATSMAPPSEVQPESRKDNEKQEAAPKPKPKTAGAEPVRQKKQKVKKEEEKPVIEEEKTVVATKEKAIPTETYKPKVNAEMKASAEVVVKRTETVPAAKTPAIKKKRKQNIIWITIVLLAAVLINIWVIFHKPIAAFLKPAPVADTLGRLVEADTTMQLPLVDTVVAPDDNPPDAYISGEAAAEEETADAKSQPAGAGIKKYYIVAGCFGEEVNADAMVKELIRKGYKAQKYCKRGNLFCVSYASFSDRNEAVMELEKIKNEVDSKAWLNEY